MLTNIIFIKHYKENLQTPTDCAKKKTQQRYLMIVCNFKVLL